VENANMGRKINRWLLGLSAALMPLGTITCDIPSSIVIYDYHGWCCDDHYESFDFVIDVYDPFLDVVYY
jgi:hypothetical protein